MQDSVKSINIEVPEGYEVGQMEISPDSKNATISFRKTPGPAPLPKTWEELGQLRGYCVNSLYGLTLVQTKRLNEDTPVLWPTRKEAEASVALAQLCQLRNRYNGDWKPNWSDPSGEKFCIFVFENKITRGSCYAIQHTLTFETRELRNEFGKNFVDLIEAARPLLG